MSDIHMKEVIYTDNITVVTADPCRLVGLHFTVAASAHTAIFEDADAVAVFTLPDSQVVGPIDCKNAIFANGLSINPEDAATAGTVLVFYQPLPLGSDIF